MLRTFFLAMAIVASTACGQGLHFYAGTSIDDRTPSNPVIPLDVGGLGTFHLFARMDPGESIEALAVNFGTLTPHLANLQGVTLVNPPVATPGGTFDRWSSVSNGPASAFAGAGGSSPGLRGELQGNDSTYDPYTNSFYLGTVQFQANNFPGQNKEVFLLPGFSGTVPSGTIGIGIGEPPMAPGGSNQLPDLHVLIRDPSAPGLLGDYSDDGRVDAADYVIWRNQLGTGNPLPNSINGEIDQVDYDIWRANFGASRESAHGSAPTPGSAAAGAPLIQIVDQGTTPGGNRSYLVQIISDGSAGAMAVELAFTGDIADVTALQARVNSKSHAHLADDANGYELDEDTWFDDSAWEYINRGHNPFTGTITSGFAADYDAGQLFLALGSGVDHGEVTDLLQIVLEPGDTASFEGFIVRGGDRFPVAGIIQVPEPAGLVLLGVLPLLLDRRAGRRRAR